MRRRRVHRRERAARKGRRQPTGAHVSSSRSASLRGRNARFTYSLIGIALVCGGLLIARPTFAVSRPAPQHWSLWLSTNATVSGSRHEPGWLLRLKVVAGHECEYETVTGALAWRPKEIVDPVKPTPARYVLAVEGARVQQLESRGIDRLGVDATSGWQPRRLHPIEGAEAVEIPVPHWQYPDAPAEFRLIVDAARPAGFESCYLTSPGISVLEDTATGEEGAPIQFAAETLVKNPQDQTNLTAPIWVDAVVEMSVAEQETEAATTGAVLAAHPGAAVVTCTTREGRSSGEPDPFSDALRRSNDRPCASIQRFRSAALQADLTEHGVFSGLLMSAGIAILVAAFLTGGVRSRPPGGAQDEYLEVGEARLKRRGPR